VPSLVSLSDDRIHGALGTPGHLSFAGKDLVPNTIDGIGFDERWTYFGRVKHDPSGVKLDLNVYMRNGECVYAEFD
jgi:hypothetical protein